MTRPRVTAPLRGSSTNLWERFLLVALTVALFALALWRFLCAAMGDPAESRVS